VAMPIGLVMAESGILMTHSAKAVLCHCYMGCTEFG
jgi:hypothetical protein